MIAKIVRGIIIALVGLFMFNPEYYDRVISGIDSKLDSATEKMNDPVSRLKTKQAEFNGKIQRLKNYVVDISKSIAKTEAEILKENSKLDMDKKLYMREVKKYEGKEMSNAVATRLKTKKETLILKNKSIERKELLITKWKKKKSESLEALPVLKSKVEMLSTYVEDLKQRKEMAEITGDKYKDIMSFESDINSVLDKVDGTIRSHDVEEQAIAEIRAVEEGNSVEDKSLITTDDLKLDF